LEHNETPNIYKTFVNSEDARYVTWILAALTPWSSVPLPESKAGSKLPLPHASVVGREGIKLNNKTSDIVTASFRNYGEITALRDAIVRKDAYVTERGTLGMMIRRWDFVGKNWRLGVMLAIFVEVLRAGKTGMSACHTEVLS
jgi:tRNA nucleotidyltransferase (CCA-adding enzyme)